MQLALSIQMDNAAFENPTEEVVRILQGFALQLIMQAPLVNELVAANNAQWPLLDANGNQVGVASITGGKR